MVKLKNIVQLAWRNLWRNKRRTLITITSVFFAVVLAVLMQGFNKGSWLYLLNSVMHSYTGYVQVHKSGYWENKNLDNTFEYTTNLQHSILQVPGVKGIVPRLESFALASNKNKTKGILIVGINPTAENSFSALANKIVKGKYFNSATDSGALVSERLAKFLGVNVGDTLVLISKGYQGASAAGLFRVIGIVRLQAAEFDNQMVYTTINNAQNFFSIQNKLTSVVININKPQNMEQICKIIKQKLLPQQYEVMNWKEMMPELYQQYQSDNGIGLIFIALLYLIVGFGIFGTVLMMINERYREFGIMVAIGMKKQFLFSVVSFEILFMGIIGVIIGFLGSIPIIIYFYLFPIKITGTLAKTMAIYGMEPILPVAWQVGYIINQAIIVAIIVLLTIFYPMYKIYKLNVAIAMQR